MRNIFKLAAICLVGGLFTFAVPDFAIAQEAAADAGSPWNALDTFWVLFAAILVFFMQAGFGMVEAGLIRSKNAANVLMKNVMDFCFAALGYFIFGYAIMYGSAGLIFGTEGRLEAVQWQRCGAVRLTEGRQLHEPSAEGGSRIA